MHFVQANTAQLPSAVRSAVIGNAGTLVVFRVGSHDAELLGPEFRPTGPAALGDQEPFTAWLRRGIGRAGYSLNRTCTSHSVLPTLSAIRVGSALVYRAA